MKIYCPFKVVPWGDWVPTIWMAEYIKQHLPDSTICLDDIGGGHRVRTVDSNIFKWTDEFIDSTVPQDTDYDYMLSTHHRHVIVKYPEPYKKIYFEISGLFLKFILEDWYPSTFNATKPLLQQFEKLKLPDEYNAIHYSPCKLNLRNKNSFGDFLKVYEWIWKGNKNIISTGKPIPHCIDLSKIAGLIKLYVLMKAKKIYVNQSGFTAVAAMYRKRKHSYLIDANIKNLEVGPPCAPYTNVKLTGDLKPIYHYLEKQPFKDYFNWCQTDGSIGSPFERETLPPSRKLYADFEITKDESPPDYIPKKVYMDIENCPLPFNYKIEYKEVENA